MPAFIINSKVKTVAENIKMNPALLSRFDLLFILLDRPNAVMDKLLSEHVMAIHSYTGKQDMTSSFNNASGMFGYSKFCLSCITFLIVLYWIHLGIRKASQHPALQPPAGRSLNTFESAG